MQPTIGKVRVREKKMIVTFLITFSLASQASVWKSGNDGQVLWSEGCNAEGNLIGIAKVDFKYCGSACLAREDCSTFAWTAYQGGTCWMKNGGEDTFHRVKNTNCGKVVRRNNRKLVMVKSGN